jgi:hypothetical protein
LRRLEEKNKLFSVGIWKRTMGWYAVLRRSN